MSVLVIDESDSIEMEFFLDEADYPSNYSGMAHPDDYKIVENPIPVEYIFHQNSHHNRLLVRLSWKLSENRYVPMTFVCHTGAPIYFYLSDLAWKCLSERIKMDQLQTSYLEIEQDGLPRKTPVRETPSVYKKANIIGLLQLSLMGLTLEREEKFIFNRCPEYF